jgi:hypothetical protein
MKELVYFENEEDSLLSNAEVNMNNMRYVVTNSALESFEQRNRGNDSL